MKNLFKRYFALTDKGASDLVKASFASFSVYIVNMIPAILLMILFDELVLGNVKSNVFYISFSIIILVLMYLLLRIEYNTLYNATYKESANLRMDIADTLSKLPLSYFSKHNLSDLSQTIMADVTAIEHAMSHAIAKTIGFFMFFPLVSILLLKGNLKLGLSVVLPIIIGFLLIVWSKKIQLRENVKYYTKLRDNSDSFQEAIELHQEIKSFGLTKNIKNSLYKKMEEGEKIHLKAEFTAAVPLLLSGLVVQVAFAIVILVGMGLLLKGEINILYLIGYILASIKIKEGVDGVSQNIAELYYIDSMINRIKEIRSTEIQKGEDKEIMDYDIELKNVSFTYNDDTKVLKDISFTANQNEVTALVGMSGCGKTSILRLISRLYDYDGGKITIGGVDIKDISTKSLFKKISIVFQDVTLFNTSIKENIRIGNKKATDKEVKEAARLANCEEFINRLPNGYDTVIGENGATLSGGERQRISIARAFLKNAPIIILDEIAASLDVDNEKKIQESLNELTKNKTVIIISHRLKSIENVDKIVVIDNGEVEAFGNHKELISISKTYNNLVEKAKLAEVFKY
ncbi:MULTISPECIES: ABC transporter ATP-binding protein [Clostridium]|uniref:ABC transporter ATP-binding protein n=1 Tax=Clostridium cadaveris TaxID=1529 RepID=A0A1I2J2U7_9CLOT|nr:ABC transporter ATP-binding protein [Clostridium cadaveris]MDU4951536.1 ABC transporter ATP-binding protein [Clostridium sp.]MDM8311355.1 ABC transporter ATP-binding protein [Clostridium cadaveris]MDY4950507.1 ABC transporter ATP-binding protein [Clostridium cadaveris]NME63263.1 ABC transporter ATP-binding protein [Clostridium cadaveris]NWK10199.1 ABC transporter ATP-binding protein [Clostridium cadaveris]